MPARRPQTHPASAPRWRCNPRLTGSVVALVLLVGSIAAHFAGRPPLALARPAEPAAPQALSAASYLPLITNHYPPLLLGVYVDVYVGQPEGIARLQALDAWTGKRHSLVGLFIDLEDANPAYNVPQQLEALWAAGYTPVVNVTIGGMGTARSAADLASGALDAAAQAWMQAFAGWAGQGDGRFALLAPLPEMNIRTGNSYGGAPTAFRAAYQHLQTLSASQGVPAAAIRWVFAPNGWTDPTDPPIAAYYPGDAAVDLVGFSAYQWGYCPNAAWPRWETLSTVYAAVDELRAVAPGKRLLVMQTAASAYVAPGVVRPADKDAWLVSAYTYLAARAVDGVLYFNMDKECDWAVYSPTVQYSGYPQAAARPEIGYQSPLQVADRFP